MSGAGIVMGMMAGASWQAQIDYKNYLKKHKATSPETAICLTHFKPSKYMKGFEYAYDDALKCLLKKGKIAKINNRYYLN